MIDDAETLRRVASKQSCLVVEDPDHISCGGGLRVTHVLYDYREGAGMRSQWGHTTESLELVRCSDFIGPPGSGAALSQPFEVRVDGQVECKALSTQTATF